MGWEFQIYEIVQGGISVLHLLGAAAGFVVALRYRCFSPWMFLIVAAFAGFSAQSGGWLTIRFVGSWQRVFGASSQQLILGVYLLNHLLGLASQIALVVGLALVLRDVRDRLQRIRENFEDRRQGQPT